jgi:hypothetical protein
VLQTGLGNDARELRVGAPDGYWKKPISSGAWEKVTTGAQAPGEAVRPNVDTRLPPHTKSMTGTYEGQPVTLEEFAADCSPATLTVGSEKMTLQFLQDWEPGHTLLTGALFPVEGAKAPALFHGRPLLEVEVRLDGDKATIVERFRPRAFAVRIELVSAPAGAAQ